MDKTSFRTASELLNRQRVFAVVPRSPVAKLLASLLTLTFAVLALASVHSMQIRSDIHGLFCGFWAGVSALHVLIVLSKVAHKLISWSRVYRVSGVETAGTNVPRLEFDKPSTPFRPGQFTFISQQTDGRR